MKLRSQLLIWCFMLCMGGAVAAQESAPESKGESSQQPTVPAVPLRVRVSRGVSQAMAVKKVQSEYPPEARAAHIQGEVILRIIVSREGDVSKVSLVSGHPLLAPSAIDAVKQIQALSAQWKAGRGRHPDSGEFYALRKLALHYSGNMTV
jgi:TonB family protein